MRNARGELTGGRRALSSTVQWERGTHDNPANQIADLPASMVGEKGQFLRKAQRLLGRGCGAHLRGTVGAQMKGVRQSGEPMGERKGDHVVPKGRFGGPKGGACNSYFGELCESIGGRGRSYNRKGAEIGGGGSCK